MSHTVYGADVRILLDVSQSMAQNDPDNLRKEALDVLINSLSAGDKAAIWTFGQYVNLIVPHERVNDQWRTLARQKVNALGAPAIRTNIGGVLEKASYDFNFSTYNGPTDIVLITDGQVDIAPNKDVNAVERERILSQLIPKYNQANATIHTVALSDKADHALLKQLSEQTGGHYHKLTDPKLFTRTLYELSSEIVPANKLPIMQNSFLVDQSIRELTVMMYHSDGAVALIDPKGVKTSAVAPSNYRWEVAKGMTQVSISSPAKGRWQVEGELSSSDIRVISDIQLQWLKPMTSTVAKGTDVLIQASLLDDRGAAIESDVSPLIKATLRVDGVDLPAAVQGDQITSRVPYSAARDIRAVELRVDGGTFERMLSRQLHYVEPFISEVLMVDEAYEWRLYPNRFLADTSNIDAQATRTVSGEVTTQSFELNDAGYWVWRLPFDSQPGVYEVELSGTALRLNDEVMLSGRSIELNIPPVMNSTMAISPSVISDVASQAMTTTSREFVKEPMPVFEELEADLIVADVAPLTVDNTEQTMPEPLPQQQGKKVNYLTYALLSIPGVLILLVGYFLYRRVESKTNVPALDEVVVGAEELSGLDDVDHLAPDPELDLSDIEADSDDDFPEESPPATEDVFDIEPLPDNQAIDELMSDDDGELPTPENTEAPSPAMENMLDDEVPEALLDVDESQQAEENPDEELFDISSIDDDLADLDLSLDGYDPFADEEESKP